MGYILSRKAEEDIIGIFRTGAEQFGQEQAERYHKKLDKCFCFLADNPLAAHERFEITPPVRIHPVGSHLVFIGSMKTRTSSSFAFVTDLKTDRAIRIQHDQRAGGAHHTLQTKAATGPVIQYRWLPSRLMKYPAE